MVWEMYLEQVSLFKGQLTPRLIKFYAMVTSAKRARAGWGKPRGSAASAAARETTKSKIVQHTTPPRRASTQSKHSRILCRRRCNRRMLDWSHDFAERLQRVLRGESWLFTYDSRTINLHFFKHAHVLLLESHKWGWMGLKLSCRKSNLCSFSSLLPSNAENHSYYLILLATETPVWPLIGTNVHPKRFRKGSYLRSAFLIAPHWEQPAVLQPNTSAARALRDAGAANKGMPLRR